MTIPRAQKMSAKVEKTHKKCTPLQPQSSHIDKFHMWFKWTANNLDGLIEANTLLKRDLKGFLINFDFLIESQLTTIVKFDTKLLVLFQKSFIM